MLGRRAVVVVVDVAAPPYARRHPAVWWRVGGMLRLPKQQQHPRMLLPIGSVAFLHKRATVLATMVELHVWYVLVIDDKWTCGFDDT